MADPSTTPRPLTRASVREAHELIKPFIHLTPVLQCETISSIASTPQDPSALTGTEYEGQEPARPKINLFFKCENYQRVGAFKARGAFHALSRLTDGELKDGVITHSVRLLCSAHSPTHSAYAQLCFTHPNTSPPSPKPQLTTLPHTNSPATTPRPSPSPPGPVTSPPT